MINKRLLNVKNTWNTCLSTKNKSFKICMHGSLHCVLGYCSQVMSPVYKQAVVKKVTNLAVPVVKINSPELKKTYVKGNAMNSAENVHKFAEKTKLLETYAVAMAQDVQKKNMMNSRSNEKVASTFTSSVMYVPEAQQLTEIDSSKTALRSGKLKMNLKQILQDSSNSSLILLRSTNAKIGEICTPKNAFNLSPRSENASISDETLIKMSSIYKKMTFIDEPILNCEKSSRNNLYTLKRHTMNTRECTTKKTFLESQFESKKAVQIEKKVHKNKNISEIKINTELNGMSIMNSGKNYIWCTNNSEIARVQAEYNKSISTKSSMQNQIYCSTNVIENLTSTKNILGNNLYQKDTIVEKNRNFVTDINAGFDCSHEKWKNFCPMSEATKDNQFVDGKQNSWNNLTQLENRPSLKNLQINQNSSNCMSKKSIVSDNLNKREIIMMSMKSRGAKSENSKNGIEIGSLQELLENTAVLYCAANGIHQDDLSNYIDFLDNKNNIQWLEG